jgi:hypothetical protein
MAKRNQQRKQMAALQKKAHDNNPHTRKTAENCNLDDEIFSYPVTLGNTTYNLIESFVRCGGSGFPPGDNYGDVLADNLETALKNLLQDPDCNATRGGAVITKSFITECFRVFGRDSDQKCFEGSVENYPLAKLTTQDTPGATQNPCINQYFRHNPSLQAKNINQYLRQQALIAGLEIIGTTAGIGLGIIGLISCVIFISCLAGHAGPKIDRMLEKSRDKKLEKLRKAEEAQSFTKNNNRFGYNGDNQNTDDAETYHSEL